MIGRDLVVRSQVFFRPKVSCYEIWTVELNDCANVRPQSVAEMYDGDAAKHFCGNLGINDERTERCMILSPMNGPYGREENATADI